MTPDQRLLAVAIVINSALYNTGVFIASLLVQHGHAWLVALASVGVGSLSYAIQLGSGNRWIALLVSSGSWVLGIAAGLMIIWGV